MKKAIVHALRAFRRLAVAYLPALLLFATFLVSTTGCGQPAPTPFPTETAEPLVTATPTSTPTPVPLRTYHNRDGAFSVKLPATWQVVELGVTALGSYYQLGPVPVGPGPASSTLFIAPGGALTPATAAEALLCGDGCAGEIVLEQTTLAGRAAKRAFLPIEAGTLEWFFVEHQGHLIFFTLHDPDTFSTRADLISTFAFAEPAPASTRQASPTVPARPIRTPASTTLRWNSWQTATVTEAGVAFDIPDGWTAQPEVPGWAWGPVAGSLIRVGFRWRPMAPDQSVRLLLPPAPVIQTAQTLSPTIAEDLADAVYGGERVTIHGDTGWEEHALFQIGLRGYDLYIRGPAPGSLASLRPVLEHALDSLVVAEVQPAFEDPVAATRSWFKALIQDPAGDTAHAYMSPGLRAQLPAGDAPLTLLALDQRLVTYNLTWLSGSQQEAVVDAELTLPDESTVRRRIRLVRDPRAGWQVDSVELTPAEG